MLRKRAVQIILVILVVYLVRELIYIGLRQNNSGKYDKLNELFLNKGSFEQDANLLIIGSSLAETHYHTGILDSITGLHTYNAGLEGASLPMDTTIYKAWIEVHPSPKYLILNLDLHRNIETQDSVPDFPKYFPYLSNKALYTSLCCWDDRFTSFKYIPFYSLYYTGYPYINNSIRGYIGKPAPLSESYVNGFCPVPPYNQRKVDTIKGWDYNSTFNENEQSILLQLNSLTRSNKTQLILTVSPLCQYDIIHFQNLDSIIAQLSRFANNNHIPLLNYLTDSTLTQPGRFADLHHLKQTGVQAYSTRFAHDLQQYLDK